MSLLDRVTSIYENKYFAIILILFISTFSHLYNVTGFPTFHVDEGTYMYRAMHFLALGNFGWNPSFYDHPYFGPLLLGGVLKIVNYPLLMQYDTIFHELTDDPYMVPRLIMGFFAIVDTFLVYAISKTLYGRNVGIMSALLFSAMPFSWSIRRIYLESLLLPLFLSAIFLVLYSNSQNISNKKITWTIITTSGILFGLSIFTKAPMFSMLPLLIYLIYRQKRIITHLLLFMIPVIIIPMIWPLDAMIKGEFEQWVIGISSQIMRQHAPMFDAIYNIFEIDPILFSMGVMAIIFAIIRRDYFTILGIIPFLAFFSFFISYVNWFYMIPIFGFICIASSTLILNFISLLPRFKLFTISFTIGIVTFSLVSTFLLISTDVSSFQDRTISYINAILARETTNNVSQLYSGDIMHRTETEATNPQKNQDNSNDNKINKSTVSIISSPIYSWIYKYIYSYNETLYSYTENKEIKNNNKVILILDRYFRDFLANNKGVANNTWNQDVASPSKIFEAMEGSHLSKIFGGNSLDYNFNQYPYTSMRFNLGGSPVEVLTNL